ncbi:MAG TPA: putative C-S lyase [Acholeplasmataceae bacterium]|jgi:cystathionine beta-lyase|nr:putative C-S lyase [Acholeplasmataceae bacterium]
MDYFNQPFCRLETASYKWDFLKEKTGKTIIPFTVADSDYPTAPEIIEALNKRVEHGAFGYSYLDSEYYELIKNWTKTRYGYSIEANWIVPITGVVSALSFAIRALTEKNDRILIFTPVYNPFYDVVRNNERVLVESKLLPEEKYRLNFSEVERHFEAGVKLVIFCSPHNPVGRVWTESELDTLIELALKYDVTLLSDEIHCDLLIGRNKFVAIGNYFKEKHKIISVFAPSKTFNLAGLGLANMIIPNCELRKKVETLIKSFYIGPDLLAVSACKAAYRDCAYWVDLQNEHLTSQYQFLKDFLKTRISEARFSEMEGTYLAWVDFTFLGLTSNEICERLLKYGVLFNRGDTYGKDYDGFLRINLACSKAQLRAGLEALDRFVTDLK